MERKKRRLQSTEHREKIEADFGEIHKRLSHIENLYNPQKLNLHFSDLSKADAELYRELLALSCEGLEKVEHHEEYFLIHPLYGDGMFWYDLFLLINSAALRIIGDGNQTDIPQEIVKELIETLIEITTYTTVHLGDITKRNYEALGNTLIAFYSKEILELANRRMRVISSKRAKELINRSIKSAEELVKKENRR